MNATATSNAEPALFRLASDLMRFGGAQPLEVVLPVRAFERFMEEAQLRIPGARTFALADGFVLLVTPVGEMRVRVEHKAIRCLTCGTEVRR